MTSQNREELTLGELTRRFKRIAFTGISLEQKWKQRHEADECKNGNKSGGQFLRTVIEYRG